MSAIHSMTHLFDFLGILFDRIPGVLLAKYLVGLPMIFPFSQAGNIPVLSAGSLPHPQRAISSSLKERGNEKRVWLGSEGETAQPAVSLPSFLLSYPLLPSPPSPVLCTTIRAPAAAATASASIWPLAFVGASSTVARTRRRRRH